MQSGGPSYIQVLFILILSPFSYILCLKKCPFVVFFLPHKKDTSNFLLFTLNDSYGDGGGPVSLIDSNNVTVYTTNGAYGSGAFRSFATGAYLGLDRNELEGFSQSLFKVAKNSAVPFEAAAEAAKEFARQGLSANEILKRTKLN